MTRQHSLGVLRTQWNFRHKITWIVDEYHPSGALCDVTPGPGCTYTRATWPPRGRGRSESLYSPRRIEAKLRARRCIELWQAGHTWQSIADMLGFKDRSGPWRAVRRASLQGDYEEWKKREARKWR